MIVFDLKQPSTIITFFSFKLLKKGFAKQTKIPNTRPKVLKDEKN